MKLLAAATAVAALSIAGAASAATVYNGDFELGDTGFTSTYGSYTTVPGPGPFSLYPEGYYAVGSNPSDWHNQWASFGDHTTGSGKMMILNGAPSTGEVVWSQSISGLNIGQKYFFSAYAASSYPTSPAVLNFSVDGSPIGVLNATSTTGDWQLFYASFTAAAATQTISLVNANTERFGNDFVLDDIAITTGVPGVPEPATWALMIGGFGLVGATLRRRRLVLAA